MPKWKFVTPPDLPNHLTEKIMSEILLRLPGLKGTPEYIKIREGILLVLTNFENEVMKFEYEKLSRALNHNSLAVPRRQVKS